MFELKIPMPEGTALVAQAEKAMQLVEAITIDSPAMFEAAAGELQSIKAKAKALDEQRTGITGPLLEVKRKIDDLFRRPLEILGQAETLLKGSMLTYQRDEDEKRQAEQRRLDELARKERDRLAREAAEAEAKARAQADEQRRKAEEAAAAGDAAKAAKLGAKADATLAAGQEKAAILQQTAQVITAPIAQMQAPKAHGVSVRDNWKAECTDLMALAKAVVAGTAPLSLIQANDKVIGQTARALKAEMKYPGVRVWNEQGVTSRAA